MSTSISEIKKDCEFCSPKKMEEMKIEPGCQDAFRVYCGYFHFHEDAPLTEDFYKCYKGEFKSAAEFCKELYDSCDDSYGALSDTLKKCIDWNAVWEYSVKYECIFEHGYIFHGV